MMNSVENHLLGASVYRPGFEPGARDVRQAIDELVGEAMDRGSRSTLIEYYLENGDWQEIAEDHAALLLSARDEIALEEAQSSLRAAVNRLAARYVNNWSGEEWQAHHDRLTAHAQDEE